MGKIHEWDKARCFSPQITSADGVQGVVETLPWPFLPHELENKQHFRTEQLCPDGRSGERPASISVTFLTSNGGAPDTEGMDPFSLFFLLGQPWESFHVGIF